MAKNSGFPYGTLILVLAGGGLLYFWYVGSQKGETNPISAVGAGISNAVQGFQAPLDYTLGGLGLGAGGYGAYKLGSLGSSIFGGGASATTTTATTAASDAGSSAAGDTYNFFGDIGNWFDNLNLSGVTGDLANTANDIPVD